MKKLSTYIVLFISILMLTVSCVIEDTVPNTPDSKGGDDIVLGVSILSGPESTKASDPNVLNENEYAVSSVRLYVFNNIGTAASPNYKFEKTELFKGTNILEKTESGCKVKIAVKKGLGKKIIVILNEPTRLTNTLNNYKTIKEINGIQFDMLDDYPCKPISWSRQGTGLNQVTTSYSYGIRGGIYSFFDSKVGDYVLPFYGESSEFLLTNKPSSTITIPVKRAVARVDLYITSNDAGNDYYFAGFQRIIEVNSKERHESEANGNILLKNYNKTGMMAPVALLNPVVTNSSTSYTYSYSKYPNGGASMSKPWSEADDLDNLLTSNNNAPSTTIDDNYIDEAYKIKYNTPTRICHIYVPEIGDVSGFSLQANSLQIQLSKISIKENVSTYLHDNVIDIPDFIKLEKFTKLERNKVYKIYCTISAAGQLNISNITIANWSDVTVDGDIHGSEIILPGGRTYYYIQQAVGSNITVPVISRGDLSMSRFVCRRNEVYEYYKYSNSTYTKLSESSPNVIDEGPISLANLPVWVKGGISLTYSKTYNGLRYYNLSVTKKGNHITYGGYVAVTSSTTPKPPTGATHRRLRIEEKRVSVYFKCDVSEKTVAFYIN